MTAPGFLDWHTHRVGPDQPCRICGNSAMCRDHLGRPCPKPAPSRSRPPRSSATPSPWSSTSTPTAPTAVPPNRPGRTPAVSHADRLRADALRWILSIADNYHLPLPSRIETYQPSSGWHLHLHLDDDQGDDVRRWADTLNLPMAADLTVTGSRRTWTAISASGAAPDIVFAGWDTVRIDSYCDFTAISTAGTTLTAAA